MAKPFRADFAKVGYLTPPRWSYRNHWWVSHNPSPPTARAASTA